MPKIADLPSLDGLDGSETVVVEKGIRQGGRRSTIISTLPLRSPPSSGPAAALPISSPIAMAFTGPISIKKDVFARAARRWDMTA